MPFKMLFFRWGLRVFILIPILSMAWHLGDEPYGHHSWRETDGLMVARNFCTESKNILYPRIDARRNTDGITGMEFPWVQWVSGQALCLGLSPIVTWRVIGWLTSILAAFSLAHLKCVQNVFKADDPKQGKPELKQECPKRLALMAFWFGSPLVVYFGRSTQPDMPALSCMLLALYLMEQAITEPTTSAQGIRRMPLFLSALYACAGLLLKLPVAVFGLPMLALLLSHRGQSVLHRWDVWLAALLATVPALLWYRHANKLSANLGFDYFFLGKAPDQLLADLLQAKFYDKLFGHFVDVYYFAPVAIAALIFGILYFRSFHRVFQSLLVAVVLYYPLCGYSAAHHDYYGLVAMVALAPLALHVMRTLEHRFDWRPYAAVLVTLSILSIHTFVRSHRWHAQPAAVAAIQDFAAHAQSLIPIDQSVLVLSQMDPTLFWYLDRKGSLHLQLPKHLPQYIVFDERRHRALQTLKNQLRRKGYNPIIENAAASLWTSQK